MFKRCHCPIWIQGTWDGKPTRHSLDVDTWVAAERKKREIEDGIKPQEQPKTISIESALAAFIADCEARNLNDSTLRKYRGLQRRLVDYGQTRGKIGCSDFDA